MPQCDLCQKVYTSEFAVQRHKRAIHDRRPYGDCTACGKSFMSLWGLNRHKKSHAGTFKFTCDDCGQGFQEAAALTTHKTIKHQAAKGHRCEICKKEFTHAASAYRHRQVHREERAAPKKEDIFKCATCGKIFKTKRYLTQHMIKHNQKSRYMCASCGHTFKWRSSLNQHQYKCGVKK